MQRLLIIARHRVSEPRRRCRQQPWYRGQLLVVRDGRFELAAFELQRFGRQYGYEQPCERFNGSLRSSIYKCRLLVKRDSAVRCPECRRLRLPAGRYVNSVAYRLKEVPVISVRYTEAFVLETPVCRIYINGYFSCPPPGTVTAATVSAITVVRTETIGRARRRVRIRPV